MLIYNLAANTEELVCPPPPIISKVSLSIGKPNRPAKVKDIFIFFIGAHSQF